MARKKSEGIESLVSKVEPVSIQEITMLDWYAAFALMASTQPHEIAAEYAFNRAEAMMKEREKRV
jgi:hypothetical protein